MRASILAVALAFISTGISAQTPDITQALARQFNERLGRQMAKLSEFEVLKQSYHHPRTFIPTTHVFMLRLGQGIEVVTESHHVEGVLEQKDYFFEEGRVYAHRVSHQVPCIDGKTKRVTENYFLLHEGKPFYRTLVSARVPLSEKEPDLSKSKEQATSLPPDLEGWGDKLTARAYAIARTFRPGIGRYTFGDWDAWLLKNAPPEGTGEPEKRTEHWLPAADTTVLPIPLSESPEGFYEVGWGYEKGPVDWKALAYIEGGNGVALSPTFSTKLAKHPLPPELEADGNFLLNRNTGKIIAKLGTDYPGERQRFNHDELILHWSPASTCFVAIATQKWFTEYGEIAWIKDGKCEGSNDILQPLQATVVEAVKKSKHPSGKRMREGEEFEFTLSNIMVEDDGAFEAKVAGHLPKDPAPGAFYEATVKGTLSLKPQGEPAALNVGKITVLPPSPDN